MNGSERNCSTLGSSSGGRRGGGDFSLGDLIMISEPLEKDPKGKNSVDTSLIEFNEV